MSTYGVMFTPNQEQAASELIRVCKPGGKIGMTNWAPQGFIGQLFKTLGGYITPPAGINSPARWGTDEFLQAQYANNSTEITSTVKQFNFRYESVEHWLEIFGPYYGPILKAFESLESDKAASLRKDLICLLDAMNTAKDGTLDVPSDYLEIVITH